MIWNSIGLYFFGRFGIGGRQLFNVRKRTRGVLDHDESTCQHSMVQFLVWIFGQCSFGIYTNAVDSIKLGGDVVFHLRYNAKSTWQRYCEQMSTCTGHSLQEEEVLSWLG